jgi:hypothetical protein
VEIVSEDPGQCSDHRQKVTGLKSESVTGIIPESWPASFRTTARDDFELVAVYRRNPHEGNRAKFDMENTNTAIPATATCAAGQTHGV